MEITFRCQIILISVVVGGNPPYTVAFEEFPVKTCRHEMKRFVLFNAVLFQGTRQVSIKIVKRKTRRVKFNPQMLLVIIGGSLPNQ